jgi:large subunit ribosomal protein L25
MIQIQLNANKREEQGRSASRRLRRSGLVPAIVYGASDNVELVSIDHNKAYHALKKEEFHTSIIELAIDGKSQNVLLRDFQVHPFRQQLLHIDFQRVNEKEEVDIRIPLHFINEDVCFAVKTQSAHITHVVNEVMIRAFVKDIPQYIEVDIKDLKAGQTLHLSDLKLSDGVKLVNLLRSEDSAVVIAGGITEQEDTSSEVLAAIDIPTISGKKTSAE